MPARANALPLALGAAAVVAPGLAGGGYADSTWLPLVGLFAGLALWSVAASEGTLGRGGIAALAIWAGFAVWIAASALWGTFGDPATEATRALVYVAAFAVGAVVGSRASDGIVLGIGLGATTLAVVSLIGWLWASAPDTYHDTLLRGPTGYPNALGVVAGAGGLVLCGLRIGGGWSRVLVGAAAVCWLTVGLTGSIGAMAAVSLGLLTWVGLGSRSQPVAIAPVVAALAGAGSGYVITLVGGTRGLAVVAAVVSSVAVALGVSARMPQCRVRLGLPLVTAAALLVLAAVLGYALLTPSASVENRRAYWSVAAAVAADHPVLGAGAGSFAEEWLARREIASDVQDAHSLFLETAAELGFIGLALLGAAVGIPLLWGLRGGQEGDLLAISAYIAILSHAAIDWDWEMPVVMAPCAVLAGALANRGPNAGAARKPSE